MVLVTAAAGVLAWRHRSRVIAVLGLAGGFATPFLLSTGEDRPIALFGYLLLLNAGLVVLARRRGWPALGLLGIAGTALYEAYWIVGKMGPDRVPLGLAILGVFAALYALAGAGRRPAPPPEGAAAAAVGTSTWTLNQAGGVLLPFLFAFHLARSADLGTHVAPVAALLLLLSAAAAWIARGEPGEAGGGFIALGAAGGDLAVLRSGARAPASTPPSPGRRRRWPSV